jgi:hypothetical protein
MAGHAIVNNCNAHELRNNGRYDVVMMVDVALQFAVLRRWLTWRCNSQRWLTQRCGDGQRNVAIRDIMAMAFTTLQVVTLQ